MKAVPTSEGRHGPDSGVGPFQLETAWFQDQVRCGPLAIPSAQKLRSLRCPGKHYEINDTFSSFFFYLHGTPVLTKTEILSFKPDWKMPRKGTFMYSKYHPCLTLLSVLVYRWTDRWKQIAFSTCQRSVSCPTAHSQLGHHICDIHPQRSTTV